MPFPGLHQPLDGVAHSGERLSKCFGVRNRIPLFFLDSNALRTYARSLVF
jgi:hypothetical protein